MSAHYYIERNSANNNLLQLDSQKYGPVKNHENTHYRTISLFEIACPDADLYSDVDAFGLFLLYEYFTQPANKNSPILPEINGNHELRLDFLFDYYYDPNFDENDPINYPVRVNFRYRWLNFSIGHALDSNDNPITIDDPTSGGLVYQGFIEKINNAYDWVADQVTGGNEHISKALLRKRAEAFAHFQYQFDYDFLAIAGVLWEDFGLLREGGQYEDNLPIMGDHWGWAISFPDLLKNSTAKPIRFERSGQLSLFQDLSEYLEGTPNPTSAPTSSAELDYVLNRFLSRVKQEFLNEKNARGY